MRRTFHILEDFFFLAIFIVVAALVTLAVYSGDDAYPLASSTAVVTSAEERGTLGPQLETVRSPEPPRIATTPPVSPVATRVASVGDSSPN